GFVAALHGRHAVATTGPWLDVRVDGTAGPGDQVTNVSGSARVHVEVAQASFVHATRVRILVGGAVARTIAIAPGRSATLDETVAIGSRDTWIGVDVAGDEPLPADLV